MDSASCVLRLADQPHSPGAGNVSDDTGLAGASEILKEGVPNEARAGEFSSGRGGAGNIVDAQHIAKEVDPVAPAQANFHTGRGGEGNIHIDKYGGHSKPPKDKESKDHKESLLDKAKHAIGLDKEKHKETA